MSRNDDIIAVEWADSPTLKHIELVLFFALLVSLVVILVVFKEQFTLAVISLIFILIWFVVAAIDSVAENNKFFENVGLGKNGKVALAAFFGGILVAVTFQVLPLQTTSLLYLASTTPTSFNFQADWNIIWIGIVFALAEEMLWRNTLIPCLYKNTGMKFTSILVGNLTFALAHFAAVTATLVLKYGVATPEQLLLILFSDFAFGMACSIGNGMAKTSSWGYGLHVANNMAKLISGVL